MNRRQFIKSASIAAAAATISPLGISAGEQTTKQINRSGHLNLSFEPYELRLRHSFNLANSQRTSTPDVQVAIEYDGMTGYGEASMPPYLGETIESVCAFLSRLDLSQFSDPFAIDEIHDYMDRVAPDNRAAKASVDIALHDLIGKITGQPLYRLWGLNATAAPLTSYTVSYDADTNEQQVKIAEALPYKVIKVKMGVDHDRELVETIRRHTDTPISVDVNQGWSDRDKALDMCHWLNSVGCLFVEQPMPKEMTDDIAWLRERSPLPIIADEAVQRLDDIRRCIGVYDGINIKLMKSTGLKEAHQMATVARALGMKVMIGCMTETSCGVTAAAQLSPLADWADLDGNLLIANDRFDGLKINDGKIIIPNRPGIGVELL